MGKALYNKTLKDKATHLRNNMTFPEKKIWYEFLRKLDIPINRQKIIDIYIVDFYCSKANLVIEIDGDTHFSDEEIEFDKKRTTRLESLGFKVIRFNNNEIINNFDNCAEEILSIFEKELKVNRLELIKYNF